jgi:hypothetical protein
LHPQRPEELELAVGEVEVIMGILFVTLLFVTLLFVTLLFVTLLEE